MNAKSEFKDIIWFLIAFIIIAIIYSVYTGNSEFIYTGLFLIIFVIGLAYYNKTLHLTNHILFGLAAIIISYIGCTYTFIWNTSL
jgi:hypothetical protein